MKVLVIWENVPESVSLYAVDGELAETALLAANKYINSDENDAILALNLALETLEPLPDNSDGSFDLSGFDRAVICGVLL